MTHRIAARLVPACALVACASAHAHSGGSAGLFEAWLHPLTGADHFVAMVAVGAWSAQLGGRAQWAVPGAFLLAMLVGGLVGFSLIDLSAVEIGVALSVLLLGGAIAFGGHLATPLAAAAVGVFGFCHGYLHGYELTVVDQRALATLAFMSTTALLHVAGLAAAHLALQRPAGAGLLKISGGLAAAFGAWLVASRLLA